MFPIAYAKYNFFTELGQRVRVTKGFGKRLKLKISSPMDFEKTSLVVQLFDLDLKTSFNAETNGGSNSFIIEVHRKLIC